VTTALDTACEFRSRADARSVAEKDYYLFDTATVSIF
jgi:hypothetical protein